MLVTYWLTVRLLARQQMSLGTPNWSSNWMGGPTSTPLERRCTWRKLLNATKAKQANENCATSRNSTPQHAYSAASTDTEVTTIDTHELWIQESDPAPCTMSALGAFGAEMLRLSRGLEAATRMMATPKKDSDELDSSNVQEGKSDESVDRSLTESHSSFQNFSELLAWPTKRRRASTFHEGDTRDEQPMSKWPRKRGASLYEVQKLDFFEDFRNDNRRDPNTPMVISPLISPIKQNLRTSPRSGEDLSPSNVVVTWEPSKKNHRRGSSFGQTRISAFPSNGQRTPQPLRRSVTLRYNGNAGGLKDRNKNPSSPCLLQKYCAFSSQPTSATNRSIRSHHSRNSSVISRNSSRHGRIIRLEQKATKVLGVVFFTFVILWAPFFILNLLPTFCAECDKNIDNWVFQLVTWLGYASSMVNPIFYTIFNKVFRQAFKKVLTCKYRKTAWRPHR
ncbi:hypothetical protein WA026_000665 [Henosepilachna vigintioctopunctata]